MDLYIQPKFQSPFSNIIAQYQGLVLPRRGSQKGRGNARRSLSLLLFFYRSLFMAMSRTLHLNSDYLPGTSPLSSLPLFVEHVVDDFILYKHIELSLIIGKVSMFVSICSPGRLLVFLLQFSLRTHCSMC